MSSYMYSRQAVLKKESETLSIELFGQFQMIAICLVWDTLCSSGTKAPSLLSSRLVPHHGTCMIEYKNHYA